MAHLSIGGQENPAPPEWIAHVLCDRYKWPLENVRAMSLPEALLQIGLLGWEAETNRQLHGQ